MDLIGDSLFSGRSYRLLNVLDEGNRQVHAIEADFSLPSIPVVEHLDDLVANHGAPGRFRCDNRPEFIADALRAWCAARGITVAFFELGKPNRNAYIERYNRAFRGEVPDAIASTNLDEVRGITKDWYYRYKTERAHENLGDVPPLNFLPRATHVAKYSFKLCALRESLRPEHRLVHDTQLHHRNPA
jgi:putative transposase